MEADNSEKAIAPSDVDFNAHAIAAAWEAADELPVCVAVAITNEFTDETVTAAEGEAVDRDVDFRESNIMVEEKAVGVCPRETAEQYAQAYVELDRRDGYVLALTPAQIFTDHTIPA